MQARRTLSSLVFIGAIALVGWWAVTAIRAQDRGPELVAPREAGPLAVRARTLAAGSATVAVEAYGTLLAARETRLASEWAGRVVRQHPDWRPGGRVAQGEEILALDPALAELDERSVAARLAEAEAALAGAERRARALSDQLPLHETSARLAARELERLEGVEAVESALRVDAARRLHNAAELELALARERLDAAAADVEVSTARVLAARAALELARERRERLVLRAPFDGHFSGRPPGLGARLLPGTPVAHVIDVTRLHLRVDVPEGELGGLREGLAARVRLPSRPDLDLPGTVRAVSVRADPTLRAVGVEIEVENDLAAAASGHGEDGAAAERPLAAGQFARAEIEIERLDDALVIFPGEFRRPQGRALAHVVVRGPDAPRGAARADRLERRELQLGRRVRAADGRVGFAVLAGLAPGDVLALSPQDRLSDGAACVVLGDGRP